MRTPHRPSLAIAAAFAVTISAPAAVLAHGGGKPNGKAHSGAKGDGGPTGTTPAWPSSIALPGGFQPEGIATDGRQLFVGSIPTGAVYRADPRTGEGSVLVPPRTGRAAIGLKVASKQLVVAGGTTGRAFIYDARTGADVADIPLTTGNAFVNDVAIAKKAAWLTDSRQPQLYKVSLDGKRGHHAKRHGRGNAKKGSPAAPTATTIPITGAMQYDADPATIDANGIVALKHGKELLVVQSRTGQLFRIDAKTGVSVEVPVAGGPLTNGDGLLLRGRTLYVVQNRLNQIAVVSLNGQATSGAVSTTITSPLFRVPTTLTKARGALYAVNARFGTAPSPTTDYDIVRVPQS